MPSFLWLLCCFLRDLCISQFQLQPATLPPTAGKCGTFARLVIPGSGNSVWPGDWALANPYICMFRGYPRVIAITNSRITDGCSPQVTVVLKGASFASVTETSVSSYGIYVSVWWSFPAASAVFWFPEDEIWCNELRVTNTVTSEAHSSGSDCVGNHKKCAVKLDVFGVVFRRDVEYHHQHSCVDSLYVAKVCIRIYWCISHETRILAVFSCVVECFLPSVWTVANII